MRAGEAAGASNHYNWETITSRSSQRPAREPVADQGLHHTIWIAVAILGTSAGWLAYSQVGTPDLAMSALFSTAMLLGMIWLRTGAERWLIAAAASLAAAVLAKGLVPLALSIPFAWQARARWKEL